MAAVFTKVIQVIQGAIPDIMKVIEESGVHGSFSIKIIIYRNYNSTA
jgi:hypothetical protein